MNSASVDLPADYLGSLPVANLLPFEFRTLSLEFSDPNDLNSRTLGVVGDFQLAELQTGLRELLGPTVTPTVSVGGGTPGSLEFDLAIDSLADGVVRPLTFGPITLGLDGLQVAGLTLAGSLTLGGLVDGVTQRGGERLL